MLNMLKIRHFVMMFIVQFLGFGFTELASDTFKNILLIIINLILGIAVCIVMDGFRKIAQPNWMIGTQSQIFYRKIYWYVGLYFVPLMILFYFTYSFIY